MSEAGFDQSGRDCERKIYISGRCPHGFSQRFRPIELSLLTHHTSLTQSQSKGLLQYFVRYDFDVLLPLLHSSRTRFIPLGEVSLALQSNETCAKPRPYQSSIAIQAHMAMPLGPVFQEIVGRFHIASEDQRKIWDYIKSADTRPLSAPDWLDSPVSGSLWANLLGFWDKMHGQLEDDSGRVQAVTSTTISPRAAVGMQPSDPSVHPLSLPPDLETYMLREAQEHYGNCDEPPSFVSPRRQACARSVIIPTDKATVPDIPTKTTAVKRKWNADYVYHTMDVNEHRLIVKSFPGGHPKGGARYLFWRGPQIGFDPRVFAFTDKDNADIAEKFGIESNENEPRGNISQERIGLQEDLVKSLRSGRRL